MFVILKKAMVTEGAEPSAVLHNIQPVFPTETNWTKSLKMFSFILVLICHLNAIF